MMTDKVLTCLAKLGDHLGLPAIVTAAAEELVKLPWENNMQRLADIIQMPVYQNHQQKLVELLHLPGRGACTELQVLQLLENMNFEEADIAAVVQVDIMQPAELQVLMGILTNAGHSRTSMLLHKAVQHRIKCEAAQANFLVDTEKLAISAKHVDSPIRCIPNIRFSEPDGFQIDVPMPDGFSSCDCCSIQLPFSTLQVRVGPCCTGGEYHIACVDIDITHWTKSSDAVVTWSDFML